MKNSRSRVNNQSGFTLLEVLVAMAILVFIAFSLNESTSQTYRLRDELLHEGDFQNSIKLSMDLFIRDLQNIYSPTLITQGEKKRHSVLPGGGQAIDPADAELYSGELSQTTPYWGPALDRSGLRPARFVGEAQKISFISSSHVRVYKDAPESEFAKVMYDLVPNENPEVVLIEDKDRLKSTSILTKTQSTNVFNTDPKKDKFERKFHLLAGIKTLKFRYYSRPKEKWFDTWDSDKVETKNIVPDIIEIVLEVLGPNNLYFEGSFKVKPEIPINGLDARF